MCVIYACASALPGEEELHNGAWRNDHGAGLSWIDEASGKVQWVKGLKDEVEVQDEIVKRGINFPLAIHFRIASAGGKDLGLTHPFPVAKDVPTWLKGRADTVLMHNGHIMKWEEMVLNAGLASKERFPEDDLWSDSRALAWLVHLKGPGVLKFVNNSSRILLMHSKPQYMEEDGTIDPWAYFSFWGDWTGKREDGWLQSTTTGWSNRGGIRYSRADEIDDENWSSLESYGCADSTKVDPNVWSMAELHKCVEDLRKELDDARAKANC